MRRPSLLLASALCLAPRLASAQTAPRPEPPLVETARLRVDAPPFTKVLGRPGRADAAWTQVCSAPCDTPVPIDWQYMLQAPGIRTSRTFQLDAYEDESVVVHLHPAYKAWVVAGGLAAGSGAALAAIGLPVLLIVRIGCGVWGPQDNDCANANDSELRVVAAVSAGLIALGVVAMVTNQTTTVSQDQPTPAEAPREPVWRTTERRDVPPLSATLAAPLVRCASRTHPTTC